MQEKERTSFIVLNRYYDELKKQNSDILEHFRYVFISSGINNGIKFDA